MIKDDTYKSLDMSIRKEGALEQFCTEALHFPTRWVRNVMGSESILLMTAAASGSSLITDYF